MAGEKMKVEVQGKPSPGSNWLPLDKFEAVTKAEAVKRGVLYIRGHRDPNGGWEYRILNTESREVL